MAEPAVTWNPPANVIAAIDALQIRDVQGSLKSDGRPVQLSPPVGVVALGRAMKARFPTTLGPPQLRAGSAHHGTSPRRDVHEEGRAIDLMIPNITTGEEIANFLSLNAQALGLQGLIFRRKNWYSNYPAGRRLVPYGGRSPHTDHVHFEVSPDYAYRSATQVNEILAQIDAGGGGGSGPSTSSNFWLYAFGAVLIGGAAALILTKDSR